MSVGGIGSPIPSKEEENKHFPKGFFDGMCLLPSFYQPETEDLRWATHNNVRKSLFFAVFRNIKYTEFQRLKDEKEDFFELMDPLEVTDQEGWIDLFVEKYWSKEKTNARLI